MTIHYGVFIDLKKAFDTVDHSILLHKLDFHGFWGIIDVWFRSYLQDRTQITVIDKRSSNKAVVTYEAPQGSVLERLLFLQYVNDICFSSKNLTFICLPTTPIISTPIKILSPLKTSWILNWTMSLQWVTSNKLTLSQNKSIFGTFRPYQKRLPFAPKICILDHQTNTLTYWNVMNVLNIWETS